MIPYAKDDSYVRTWVDDASFHITGNPETDGWDHHWMYPVDKEGKPIEHKLPYPSQA
jgi:hypothetical protein